MTLTRTFLAVASVAAPMLAFAPAARGQTLVIRRSATDSVVLGRIELSRLPRVNTKATEHGKTSTFGGISLVAMLASAGVRTDSLRGPALADVLLVEARDGYRTVFALSEIASDLGARAVLLADTRDGAPLAATEGPLRLVVASDGRPARWVRQVQSLSIIRVGAPR